jgi:hypothetical protein
MHDAELPAELNALAARLGELRPYEPPRDRLLFEAGRRSAPRPVGWPIAALALAGLALALGLRPPDDRQTIVVIERPAFSTSDQLAGDSRVGDAPYLRLRDATIWLGADAIPTGSFDGPVPAGRPLAAFGRPALFN